MFLGVDGGGTKTAFVLIDQAGKVRASHQEGSSYYLETGLPALQAMLERGVNATFAQAGVARSELRFAFFGLPAFGEDSAIQPQLDALPAAFLDPTQYRCDCDMICSWAGSLACRDGISVICGTGSMAYGEYQGKGVRVGGWGELFSDEGSAYWIAREGLNLFSKMSDGRATRGGLYDLMKKELALQSDLDLCGHVYNKLASQRSAVAALSQLVGDAAQRGDEQARAIFHRAAQELASMVVALRNALQVPDQVILPVSYSGGVFESGALLLDPFRQQLDPTRFALTTPLLSPAVGAALYAANRVGHQFTAEALHQLRLGGQ